MQTQKDTPAVNIGTRLNSMSIDIVSAAYNALSGFGKIVEVNLAFIPFKEVGLIDDQGNPTSNLDTMLDVLGEKIVPGYKEKQIQTIVNSLEDMV